MPAYAILKVIELGGCDMHYIKRIYLNLTRNAKTNVTLFITLFILSLLLSTLTTLKSSFSNTLDYVYNNVNPVATIGLDHKLIESEMEDSEYPSFTYMNEKIANELGSLEQVNEYDYIYFFSVMSKELKRESYAPTETEYYYELHGVNNPDLMSSILGDIQLIEGRTFTKEDMEKGNPYVIVNKNIVKQNNLSIGSKVSLYLEIFPPTPIEDALSSTYSEENSESIEIITREYEVIGIYEPIPIEDSTNSQLSTVYYEYESVMYAPNKVVKEFMDSYQDIYVSYGEEWYEHIPYPIFLLKDASQIEDFKEQALHILSKYHTINSTLDTLGGPITTFNTLDNFITISLIITIIITIIVIAYFSIKSLHKQKEEMLSYLILGEKKIKIVGQFIIQSLILSIISITIALIASGIISNGLSKTIVSSYIDTTNKMPTEDFMTYSDIYRYLPSITNEDLVNYQHASLQSYTIAFYYSITLGSISIGLMAPFFYISRLKKDELIWDSEVIK